MKISSVQIPQGTPEGSWWVREWATTLIEEVRWLSEQGWATTKSIQHLLEVARSHMSIGLKFKIKARLSLCRMSANARRTCFGRWKGGLCEIASVMQVMIGRVTPAKRPAQAGWGRLTGNFKCLDMLYTSLYILGEGLAWICHKNIQDISIYRWMRHPRCYGNWLEFNW